MLERERQSWGSGGEQRCWFPVSGWQGTRPFCGTRGQRQVSATGWIGPGEALATWQTDAGKYSCDSEVSGVECMAVEMLGPLNIWCELEVQGRLHQWVKLRCMGNSQAQQSSKLVKPVRQSCLVFVTWWCSTKIFICPQKSRGTDVWGQRGMLRGCKSPDPTWWLRGQRR